MFEFFKEDDTNIKIQAVKKAIKRNKNLRMHKRYMVVLHHLEGLVEHILFEDESMIRDYQPIQKIWFIKGHQKKIPTYGKHCGVKLLGILNYETGCIYCEEHDKYDAEVFLKFLKNILSQYQTGNIVIVLDNARIHHAKLIQPFLDENKNRLTLAFLPPYSPNLNLIEGL